MTIKIPCPAFGLRRCTEYSFGGPEPSGDRAGL